MSLLSGNDLMREKPKSQFAIPCFDVAGGNIDFIHAICKILARRGACAFFSSTPSSIKDYFGMNYFIRWTEEITEEYDVRAAAHLDHATEVGDIEGALEAGFSSVMFDGSKLPFKENVKLSKEVARKAHKVGASVEAELGIIVGKEDEIVTNAFMFPTLGQSLRFIEETGIDFFAPAIGTIHGFYRGKPKIRWEFVNELSKSCNNPLVLHGGTGIEKFMVRDLIDKGFRKINYATGIRAAFRNGIHEILSGSNESVKPQVYLRLGREKVENFVSQTLDIVMEN